MAPPPERTFEEPEAVTATALGWDRHVDVVVRSLSAQLGADVDPDVIRDEVEAGFAAFAGARVRDFVPVLVEAGARSRLIGDRRP